MHLSFKNISWIFASLLWWNNCLFQAPGMSTRQPKEGHHWKYLNIHLEKILVESEQFGGSTSLSLSNLLGCFPGGLLRRKEECLFGNKTKLPSPLFTENRLVTIGRLNQHKICAKHLAAAFSLVMIQASREGIVQGSNNKTALAKKHVC